MGTERSNGARGSSVSRRVWNRSHGTRKEERPAGEEAAGAKSRGNSLPAASGQLAVAMETRVPAGPPSPAGPPAPRSTPLRRRVRGGPPCVTRRGREARPAFGNQSEASAGGRDRPVANPAGGRGCLGTRLPLPPPRRPRAPEGTVQTPASGAPRTAAAASPSPKPRETSAL